ncbi:DUF6285 domain-containing protein [Parapedomonas caeni]|jgi:hypothetical protein
MAIPNAVDLVQAVRRFLEQEIAHDLKGRKAFHAKVAANALAIVERELSHNLPLIEREAYGALLGRQGSAKALRQALCAAIRDGALDDRSPGVLDALKAVTVARMAVDNPKYSTFLRMTSR